MTRNPSLSPQRTVVSSKAPPDTEVDEEAEAPSAAEPKVTSGILFPIYSLRTPSVPPVTAL